MLRRLSFVFPFMPLALGATLGCGSGISNRDNPSIATVSGQLSGSTVDVPAGAKVALVWRSPTSGQWVVTAEAAVAGGAFSINLDGAPSDDLFFDPSNLGSGSGSGGVYNGGSADEPPTSGGTATAPSGGSGGGSSSGGSAQVRPMDVASGTVSAPMTVAAAGFLLYVDANGNGKLDIDSNGRTPDTVIGGSRDLALVYLRDGSSLDLEKLRDDTGQLPTRGYDLVLVDKRRWLPLNSVDLTLGDDSLPDGLCYMGPTEVGTATAVADGPETPAPAPSSGYPAPGDPNLTCSPDGRSYSYSECNPPPPPPVLPGTALCGGNAVEITEPCAGGGGALGPSDPVPPGWPCPVATDADAGVAMDGGKGP
ncbi:MAG TPA: hypothetical protein VIF62_11905 [Labilithrix sp.]|jgi:hypothetical protein